MGEIGSIFYRVGGAKVGLGGNRNARSVATHGQKAGGTRAQRPELPLRTHTELLRAGQGTASKGRYLTRLGIKSPSAISTYNSLVLGLVVTAFLAIVGVGCNTAHGFGKDVQNAGEGIQNGTK
jgi:predicted small secreted protein